MVTHDAKCDTRAKKLFESEYYGSIFKTFIFYFYHSWYFYYFVQGNSFV